MTAVSALLLALIAGWMVPAPRLAMAAFLGPWLVALIYQTADIGLGYAVSPPQTVTQFLRVIGYVVVTAVILALGLVLAALIGERRSRMVPDDARRTAREMVPRATAAGTIVVTALNTMKHAPGAPVSVTLEVIAAGLHIDIINGPARSAPLELDNRGGGAGLLGMTERVKAHGGQLSAGPSPGGGWRVSASLPSDTLLRT